MIAPSRAFTHVEIQRICDVESPNRNMTYQALKLNKIMETRTLNNHNFSALKVAKGLSVVGPETEFHEGIFSDFIFEKNTLTKCEFLIVVAMYNESAEHFVNTMIGVHENLNEFYSAGIDPSRIACVMIVDGMKPFLETFHKQSKFFSKLFDEEVIKRTFKVDNVLDCKIPNQTDYDEFAHCFMQSLKFGNSFHSLNFIFCVKQYNRRKLNTHLWFFGGFCEMFQPNYVMLLDVGTKPLKGSLFYLYEAMVCDPQLAGCCGEIKPMDYNFWKIVVPAQIVEYKFSHMLDKALESVIGYITVLPGAFSAFRWEALQGSPLWDHYFKSICHPELMDTFQSNIYLAEDRVLCLALVTKKQHKFTLRYVKKSIAETDVPDSIAGLMSQRRRWINGSWFALVDAIKRFKSIYESNHNFCRKILFTCQMFYYLLNVIYTWFVVGIFCLAFTVLIKNNQNLISNESGYNSSIIVGDILILMYVLILLVLFITSLGVKPRRVENFYRTLSLILGVVEVFSLYLIGSFLAGNSIFDQELVFAILGGTIASFALIVILNRETGTILKGVLHYIFLIPTYLNIFLIVSICNVHDCTWGNRPDSLSSNEKDRLEEFEEFRTRWAVIWALSNSGFAYLMISLNSHGSAVSIYFFSAITGFGALIFIIRIFGGIIYLIVERYKKGLRNYTKESFESPKYCSICPENKIDCLFQYSNEELIRSEENFNDIKNSELENEENTLLNNLPKNNFKHNQIEAIKEDKRKKKLEKVKKQLKEEDDDQENRRSKFLSKTDVKKNKNENFYVIEGKEQKEFLDFKKRKPLGLISINYQVFNELEQSPISPQRVAKSMKKPNIKNFTPEQDKEEGFESISQNFKPDFTKENEEYRIRDGIIPKILKYGKAIHETSIMDQKN